MEYLFLLIPLSLLLISYLYWLRYNKFKNTGRVPDILSAKRNIVLFFVLALTSAFAYFIVIAEVW